MEAVDAIVEASVSVSAAPVVMVVEWRGKKRSCRGAVLRSRERGRMRCMD